MDFEPSNSYLRKIWMKGYNAYLDGKEYNENPHSTDHQAHYEWSRGWLDSERDDTFSIDGAHDHGLD